MIQIKLSEFCCLKSAKGRLWVVPHPLEKSYMESACRSDSGQNRSFPETENPADAGFLIGNYRPEPALPLWLTNGRSTA